MITDPTQERGQAELNAIQYWLKHTSEPYNDWDWTGKELIIFTDEGEEIYSLADVEELIFKDYFNLDADE